MSRGSAGTGVHGLRFASTWHGRRWLLAEAGRRAALAADPAPWLAFETVLRTFHGWSPGTDAVFPAAPDGGLWWTSPAERTPAAAML